MTGADTILEVRVRPGREAVVINISPDGALIETTHRLLPGTAVELQLDSAGRRIFIRGRVLRCCVACVRPASLVYRGAIAFERTAASSNGPGENGTASITDQLAVPPRAAVTQDGHA